MKVDMPLNKKSEVNKLILIPNHSHSSGIFNLFFSFETNFTTYDFLFIFCFSDLICFDNSYSMITSKVVHYRFDVLSS